MPTNAGVILFAQDVIGWLPGAYLQFLRVDGCKLSDEVVQDHELSGDLFTLLRELDAVIEANINQRLVSASPLREEEVPEYPIIAIRELLMNAIMHRDYASTAPVRLTWFTDRIEIQSPGGLYGEASEANFPNQTSYRNPVIAEALKGLGYVNRCGRGVIRARDAMAKNRNPEPDFRFEPNYVLATLRRPS